MTQPWSGQACAEGWGTWRLPSDVGQALEAVKPEGAIASVSGLSTPAPHSAQQPAPTAEGESVSPGITWPAAPAAPLGAAPANPPAIFSPESLGPNGWQRDDYQSYLMLTGGMQAAPVQQVAYQPPQSDAQFLPDSGEAATDAIDSQRLAQESIEVLNRIWSQFESDSVSRSELKAFILESRLGGEDRSILSRLVEDDQAFNWLDRLGGTFTDGRITQATVTHYAVGDNLPSRPEPNRQAAGKGPDSGQSSSQDTAAGGQAGRGAGSDAKNDAESGSDDPRGETSQAGVSGGVSQQGPAKADIRPTPDGAGGSGKSGGGQASNPEEGVTQDSVTDSASGLDYGLLGILSRNFGILDQMSGQSKVDLAVTFDELKAASKSAVFESQTSEALAFIASDKDRFAQFDALDGRSDGRISWQGVVEAEAASRAPQDADASEQSAMTSMGRLPDAPSPQAADYSPIFYAGAEVLGGKEWDALFDGAGEIDLEALRKSGNETLRELANDPLGFGQLDALDGKSDGRISRQGIIEATEPGRIFFDTKVKGEDGQEVSVLTAAYGELGKKYDNYTLPDLPEGVDNENGRAYRAAFALSDNLQVILGDNVKRAARGEEVFISVEALNEAASNEAIISEDRASLAEIANDSALFDWLCGVGEGGETSAIPLSRLGDIVSDWNRANFNDLRAAYGMLNAGVDGLAKSEEDDRGFKRGMTKEEVSSKIVDPAALTKAYNRMMSDPAIQADMTEAIRSVLPDTKGIARKISERLDSGFYVGYTDWLRTQVNPEEISARIGGEIHTLKLLDPELGERTGESLASQLMLKQAQTMGAQADEQLARDLVKLMLTQLNTTGLREARTLFRLSGNTLSAIQDIGKIPAELDKLVDAIVPRVLRPWEPLPVAASSEGKEASNMTSVIEDLTKSGVLGTVAAGIGVVLGVITNVAHANDGKPNTLQDRLTDALVWLAPLSYGNQAAKSVNFFLETVLDNRVLNDFTKLASRPASELFRMYTDDEFMKSVQMQDKNLKITSFNHASAAFTRSIIAMLDIAGGAVAATLGGMQVSRAVESGDKVDLASGALLTAGGGLWLLGGAASLATVGIASPFFVLSGVAAFAGLVTGWFKDPSKDFAQKFGEQFGSLEPTGALRTDWRDSVAQWYNDNYVDETSKYGLGLDL